MFAAEMATGDWPVLVSVSERWELLLCCSLPKESVGDDAVRREPALEPPGANSWQPVSSAIPVAIKRELIKQRCDRKTCNGVNSLPDSLNVVLAFSTGTRSP